MGTAGTQDLAEFPQAAALLGHLPFLGGGLWDAQPVKRVPGGFLKPQWCRPRACTPCSFRGATVSVFSPAAPTRFGTMRCAISQKHPPETLALHKPHFPSPLPPFLPLSGPVKSLLVASQPVVPPEERAKWKKRKKLRDKTELPRFASSPPRDSSQEKSVVGLD